MTTYDRPDELVMAEDALAGEVQVFPDILRGWGITFDQTGGIPPVEWFNYIARRTDQAIRYFMQRGLPEWSNTEDYPQGAYIQYAGVSYVSKRPNNDKEPSSNANDWSTWGVTGADLDAKTTGRLLRRSVYFLSGGVQNVSVDGAPGTTVGATSFSKLPLTGKIRVRMCGGGGGGGGSSPTGAATVSVGGGGGAGGYADLYLTSGVPATVAIAIGGGGGGGTNAGAGTAGGATSFGTLCSASGGSGGIGQNQTSAPFTAASGSGGTVTGTALLLPVGAGQPGGLGQAIANAVASGGIGGMSGFGFGGGYPPQSTGNGVPGSIGAGGSGAVTLAGNGSTAGTGGSGGGGLMVVEEYP